MGEKVCGTGRRSDDDCVFRGVNIDWLSLSVAKQQLDPALYAHLADNGSLTRRVRNRCTGRFEVQLIGQETVQLDLQERELLDLPKPAQALSRQVFLCCDQKPLVFARTIVGQIEQNQLLMDRIKKLGAHSLGSILFRDPLATKRQMDLACLPRNHAFFNAPALAGLSRAKQWWLRRSLYDYEGSRLIVYEAFIAFSNTAGLAD